MSIATRTGDLGITGLMYNRRVSKAHPRVDACGMVDELNAALGLARAAADHPFVRDHLLAIQKELVLLMGEIATLPEDLPRYLKDGFPRIMPAMTAQLDHLVQTIEAHKKISFTDWVMPGGSPASAALDAARTTCRHAERRICALHDGKELDNPEILIYLNRLSDVLWLLARWTEAEPGLGRTSEASV